MNIQGLAQRVRGEHPFKDAVVAKSVWSSDGKHIAVEVYENSQSDVFVLDPAGGKPRNITNHPANDMILEWSKDGTSVLIRTDRSGQNQIWRQSLTGGVQLVGDYTGAALEAYPPVTVPEGKYLFAPDRRFTDRPSKLTFFRFPAGPETEVQGIDRITMYGFSIAPDGRSILYSRFVRSGSDIMLIENFR